MKKYFEIDRKCLLLPAFVLLMNGCNPSMERPPSSPPSPGVDILSPASLSGEKALEYVRQLVAITPRHSGSTGALEAAQFIQNTIRPYVDSCVIDSFSDNTPDGIVTFHNVKGILQGNGSDLIILCSHYDTKDGISPSFQGANDSGSSTGILIELARVLHQSSRLPFSIVFAFFDGEECKHQYGPIDGLHGSRHFVRQLESENVLNTVRAAIILDMVGDKDLTITIPRNVSAPLMNMALTAASEEGVRKHFKLASGAILDDHVPFLNRKIPSLNLIDFEYGTMPGLNDLWHTKNDTLENISAESLQIVGRVMLRILNALAVVPPPLQ